MLKSLHYLTTRAMHFVIALVALFAVGLTASAEYYSVNLQRDGATEFRQGELRVTSSKTATSTGIVINGTQTRINIDGPNGLKGIGRVIFTPAEGTPASVLRNLVKTSSMAIAASDDVTVTNDNKIVYTPTAPEENLELYLRAGTSIFGLGGPEVTIERIEVYLGYYTHEPDTYEFTDPYRTASCSFGGGTTYVSQQGNAWSTISRSAGYEVALQAGDYVRQGSDNVVLKLVGGEGRVIRSANTLRIATGSTFDLFAPAGYAIKSVRFKGEGAEGINGVGGNTHGNLDRFWDAPDGQFEAYARFTYDNVEGYTDESADFICDQIIVTYVSLGTKPDPRFNVDDDQLWPRSHSEAILSDPDWDGMRSFWLTVHPADGVDFTSAAEVPAVTMTFTDGTTYEPRVMGAVNEEGNAVFTIFVDQLLTRIPRVATLNFPEGAICAGPQYSNEFSTTLHLLPATIYDYMDVMSSTPLSCDYEQYGYKDYNINDFSLPNPGVVSSLKFRFDGYWSSDYGLQWTYDEPLDPQALTFLDEERNEYPIASVDIKNDGTDYYLEVTPVTPITESNVGRYILIIPEAVVRTKNGYTNKRYVAGYNFYCEDSEVLKMLPGKNTTVRSLDQLVYYLPSGRSLTPTAETIDVEYAFGADGYKHLTGTVSVDEQGRGIVKFDRTFTADKATEFVMLSVNPKPFTVDGKQPGYTSLYCTIDSNLSTFSHSYTSPTWDRAVEIGFFDRNSEVYNGQRGFFISFRGLDYNLTDAQGNALSHGDRIWPDGSAPQTQGFQFIFQGADLNDMSSWKWQDVVLLYPESDTYGIFVPVIDIFPGKYHLVIPEGLINGRQVFNNSHAVNETIDLIWEVVNCAEDGAFRIVYPQMDATYKSIDKVIVECNADVTAVARTYIEDFRENVNMFVVYFDSNAPGNAKNVLDVQTNAATATLNDKGQVVYTFDSPLTFDPANNGGKPAYVALAVDPGWIYNNMGLCNREIQVASFVDPTIEYRQALYTYPDCSGVHPLSDYAYEMYRLGVHFGNNNNIAFDEDNIKYYNDPEHGWGVGAILYDSEIGFPDGYSFTEVKTGEDLTARTTVHVNLDGQWMLYFSAGTDLQPGTYRIHFPAGAIRFVDGKYNDEFEYTWTLVGTIPEEMIKVVYPSEWNEAPFDHLEIAYNADTFVPVITPVADEIDNLWLAQYADYEGRQMTNADGQHAKLSVNEQGHLIVQLDHMIDNAGMVNVEVAPSTFFDQNGNANPNLQLSFAPRCYELGSPNVSNNDLVKNLSEFHITVWNAGREHSFELAPVADDYAINFSADLYDDDYNYKETVDLGAHTGCIASIAKNDEGRNVITVSVPDVVQGRIAELTGYCELRVYLPGFNPDYPDATPTMAIRTTGGLPNREARYDFRLKPDLTYNCFFSMINMPEDVTILFDGSPIAYTENGFFIEECDDPIIPDRFSFEGLPEGVECKITIEGGDVSAKGVLDFTRYAKVMTYPFTDNTVDQTEFATSPNFSFIFDREVANLSDDVVESLKYCISGWCNYPYTSYQGGWASAGGCWFGFGLDTWSNPDIAFPVGDYHVSVPARVFQFTDGSWNPAIEYDFTVTAGTTFRIANHAVTYYTDNGLAFQKPNTTGTTNPFCNIALYFDGQTVKADDFEFSYDTASKYIDVNVLDSNTWNFDTKRAHVTLNYDTEKQQQVLVLRLDDLLLPPSAMIVIPEGALTTRDGRTNKQYDMWFNILQDGYANLNVYVDDQLDYNTCISYTLPGTAEPLYAYTGTPIDAGHLESPFDLQVESPSYYKISKGELDAENNVYNLWLVIDDSKAFGSGVKAVATANCQGGLRDAIVAFGKPTISHGTGTVLPVIPDPEIIRERIEWSEGFSLKVEVATSTGKPKVREVPNDISYVTTEVDETNKQLILHFFDAEGNDFFPFDDPKDATVKLTIPVPNLFKSSDLWDNTTTLVTAEITYSNDVEIVTGDTDYDATANATTTGKVGSLTDIILGHRRNGARTNDLDGNGSVSIGDVVRLIKRAQQ